jgi:hypothetical protein
VALLRQALEASNRLQDRRLLVLVSKHLVWWLAGAQGDLQPFFTAEEKSV